MIPAVNLHWSDRVFINNSMKHTIVEQVQDDGGAGWIRLIHEILNVEGQIFGRLFRQFPPANFQIHHLRVAERGSRPQ